MPALMLTSSTYGTWLHGDERGSIDRHGAIRRHRFLPPNPKLEAWRRSLRKFPACVLDARARKVADAAMRHLCLEKGWELRALNVRTNHFHAVLPAFDVGSKLLGALKARATRDLRRAGLVAADQPVWTSRGGVTFLRDAEAIAAAIHYVLHRQ